MNFSQRSKRKRISDDHEKRTDLDNKTSEVPLRRIHPRRCKRIRKSDDNNNQSGFDTASQEEHADSDEVASTISTPPEFTEPNIITTNVVGRKMGLMSNEDIRLTKSLQHGTLTNNKNRNKLKKFVFKSKSQLCSRRNLEFETPSWKKKIRRLYKKKMEDLPKFPCINCGCMVRNCRMRFLINTVTSIQEIPSSMWQIDPYYTWIKKEQPTMENPTFKDVKEHLRLCLTCLQQLKSKNDKLR